MRHNDNIRDMADDIGKAFVAAAVVLTTFVFCTGIMIGAVLTWGLS
jgi:hypothetical protein